MRKYAAPIGVAVTLALVVFVAGSGTASSRTAERPERPVTLAAPAFAEHYGFTDWAGVTAYVGNYVGVLMVESAVDALIHQAADYAAWTAEQERLWAEEQARIEAERQAAAAATRRNVPTIPTSTSTAMNPGGHSDAWWHGVAICEQGGRNDPYYGYFSFMDGSQGGRSWDEQVAAGNALLARVKASGGGESPAWAPACVAAGYAASPGG